MSHHLISYETCIEVQWRISQSVIECIVSPINKLVLIEFMLYAVSQRINMLWLV